MVCPLPEHVLVVDLEEPHCPGADDEVGHVDAHVEEQQPRAAPHTAPFPGNQIRFWREIRKWLDSCSSLVLVRVVTSI